MKTIPQRGFSRYQNRPQLAASMYCHQIVERLEGRYSSEGLARTPPMESLQPLNQEEQYQTLTGGNDPRRCELHCMLFPLS